MLRSKELYLALRIFHSLHTSYITEGITLELNSYYFLHAMSTLSGLVFNLWYHCSNIQQFYFLPTQCICVDLRTNSDYFPIQH